MFKFFGAIFVALYRLTGGRMGGGMRGFRLLLLTTTGRKTGRTRTVPLGVFDRPDGYMVVASNSGQKNDPAWYLNLRSDPRAQVQVGAKVLPVKAEILAGDARAQAWQQVVTESPLYARYEKQTARQIPLVVLHPAPSRS